MTILSSSPGDPRKICPFRPGTNVSLPDPLQNLDRNDARKKGNPLGASCEPLNLVAIAIRQKVSKIKKFSTAVDIIEPTR